ncbi:MAG: AMP-binding protein [Thermodesulfobacteriota bacterium]
MQVVREAVGRVLEGIVAQYPDRDALVHRERGVRYNYDLLWWEVDRAAKGLMSIGIEHGDRVALWAPNIPEWIIAFLGLSRIGAVMVPMDPGAKREDLAFILAQSECKAVIMVKGVEEQDYLDLIMQAKDDVPTLVHIVLIDVEFYPETILWTELGAMGEDEDQEGFKQRARAVGAEDPIAIMYTSGTTGKPKGVVLDHQGLINKSLFSTERQGITEQDKACLFFPLFHMFGNTCIALASLLRGAALIMPGDQFEPAGILKAIYKEQCTAVYGSPSMLIALLDHPEFKTKRWTSAVRGIVGGAPCPMELMKRLVEEIGVSHITVAYGITEASSWLTMTHPGDPLELRVGTIGTALACNEVKIVDPATQEDLPADVQGELCTRGFLMKEYYKMPVATAAAIDREGWFHTGDLGQMDKQGYVRITGRLKDVIVREETEIHPVEVEEHLYRHPEIAEVQVFGVPHPDKGHEVAAWVRIKEGSGLHADDLARYAEQGLDPSVRPRYFKIVTEFPMTRSGKVQKYRLAEMAVKEYGLA